MVSTARESIPTAAPQDAEFPYQHQRRRYMEIESEFLKQVGSRFTQAFRLIAHAVSQLDDNQIWFRPSSHSNSVGIIVQHLTGNLNQWVLDGLGGQNYKRNRPMEFREGAHLSKDEILGRFSQLGEKVQEVISHTRPETLLEQRRIQGFDQSILAALIAAVTHFELHAGQIAYISKLILNEKYQESWKPASVEEGSR
jgi:Protein of unknown function (DUF1572)